MDIQNFNPAKYDEPPHVHNNSKELLYNNLCQKLNLATTNNEILSLFDGFNELGSYKDSVEKRKQCLDKLTFSNAKELLFLGRSYKELGLSSCDEIADQCISTANEWEKYENDYNIFFSEYDSKPQLLKLWKRFSAVIIIVGLVTLLWGFIIYFGAVLLEFIIRAIVTKIKRSSDKFRQESQQLAKRKQALDSKLYELRKR